LHNVSILHFGLVFFAASLALVMPASAMPAESLPKVSPDTGSAQDVRYISRLFATPQLPEAEQWKTTFEMRQNPYKSDAPEFLLQRAEYRAHGLSLMSEMGDLVIHETPYTAQDLARRGGKMTVVSGNLSNEFRLSTFAATGSGPRESMLTGASAEVSLMKERARFKTLYIGGREILSPAGTPGLYREKNGSVLGVSAILEPVKDLLTIEAEMDYAVLDHDSRDNAASVGDTAYHVKARGASGPYRYAATFERVGPEYQLIDGNGPYNDSEGFRLEMGAGFQHHALDINLSRYNDNLDNDIFYPRLYRYQGNIDYTFKGIQSLPMGVQYGKTVVDSDREPAGSGPQASEADTFSGKVNYLTGKWNLGMKASYLQRKNKVLDQQEMDATTIAFSPKVITGPVTITPDLSLKRSHFFRERHQAETCGINMGIRGNGEFDYEVRGGYRKEWHGSPSSGRDSIGASVRMGYPLGKFLKRVSKPSLRLKGEYRDTMDRTAEIRNSSYSFLITVDGSSFL